VVLACLRTYILPPGFSFWVGFCFYSPLFRTVCMFCTVTGFSFRSRIRPGPLCSRFRLPCVSTRSRWGGGFASFHVASQMATSQQNA
jgi:hypothetical protein